MSARLPLIYIAGPFRGPTPLDVRRNVERARDLGLRVAQAGGYPVIPHTMTAEFDKQGEDQFWLDGTMEMLRRCDAIVMTKNWTTSAGACAEYQWARGAYMPVYEDNDLPTTPADLTTFVRWVCSLPLDKLDFERVKRSDI